MLADDILASPHMRQAAGKAFVDLDRYIHEAHRFDLAPSFIEAAAAIAWQNDETLARGLPVCRLPYEGCWVELSTGPVRHHMPPDANVDRIGFLLHHRRDDMSAFDAHMFFRLNGGVTTSGVSMMVDAGAGDSLTVKPIGDSVIDSRMAAYANPFNVEWLRVLRSPSSGLSSREYLARSVHDWGGCRLLIAVLALLNSKNTTTIVPAAKQKMRRREKKPLLSYSICKIDLKRRLSPNPSSDHCPTRAHFVRGHFKVRSSGVYWWSPFIRGDKSLGFVSKSYQVAA